MRILLIIISTILSLNLQGQSKNEFLFFDACTESVIERPFYLWQPDNDSTIYIKAGESVELIPNYYQLVTEMEWNEMYTGFYFGIVTNNQDRVDTLYLNKVRSYGTMVLHPPPKHIKYYYCDNLCEGEVIETDSNNTIRFRGKFREGIPTSNLKYYNKEGTRFRTEVYRNGNLINIRD